MSKLAQDVQKAVDELRAKRRRAPEPEPEPVPVRKATIPSRKIANGKRTVAKRGKRR